MRGKKIIKSLLIIVIMACLEIIPSIVEAAPLSPSLYFGITELKASGIGYSIGNPNANGGADNASASKIWNIVKYSGASTNDPTEVNVYCVKAGVGFTAGEGVKGTEEYNLQFDMYTDRTEIEAQNSVLSGLVNGQYNELLALANLIYIPGESTEAEKEQLLRESGALNVQKEYEGLENGETYKITDDEIEAVQQAAIWYFTNSEEGDKYNKYDDTTWLWYIEDGTTYANM